jgi:hypothetical protein
MRRPKSMLSNLYVGFSDCLIRPQTKAQTHKPMVSVQPHARRVQINGSAHTACCFSYTAKPSSNTRNSLPVPKLNTRIMRSRAFPPTPPPIKSEAHIDRPQRLARKTTRTIVTKYLPSCEMVRLVGTVLRLQNSYRSVSLLCLNLSPAYNQQQTTVWLMMMHQREVGC